MATDHDADLEEWGRTSTPDVDGAFANRLEASLRSEMIEGSGSSIGWRSLFFRPATVVVTGLVIVLALVFVPRTGDEVGFADDEPSETTAPIEVTTTTVEFDGSSTTEQTDEATDEAVGPSTTEGVNDADSADLNPTTTLAPGESDTATPSTTLPPDSTDSTLPEPQTTVPETTVPPETDSAVVLELQREGRVILATWSVRGDIDDVVGWVLVASIDGDGDIVASTRDAQARSLRGQVADLSQTFRVEGRDRGGMVVVESDEVSVSRDG